MTPVSGIQLDSSIKNRIRLRLDFEKKYRIRYEYLNCVGHCSQMVNQRLFTDLTGLEQIFGPYYRIMIGLDETMKILDWVRVAKISDPFNISMTVIGV